MNKKILVVGSLNIDMVVTAPNVPKIGETIIGHSFQTNAGGKGANQAAAISKLGGNVKMLGCVGDDNYGKTLKNYLKETGVDVSPVIEIKNQESGIAVITVDDNGNNNIIVVQGANKYCTPDYIDKNRELIEQCDLIVLQIEIPLETVKHCIRIAHDLNKIIVLNPAPATMLNDELYPMIDFLIPNETELEIISNRKLNSMDDIILAAKSIINKGAKNLIVTLGDKGSLYINKDNQILIPPQKVKAIDTTAAGDSYIASFVIAILEGKDIEQAAAFATKVASVVVCRKGAIASIPTREELKQIFSIG